MKDSKNTMDMSSNQYKKKKKTYPRLDLMCLGRPRLTVWGWIWTDIHPTSKVYHSVSW